MTAEILYLQEFYDEDNSIEAWRNAEYFPSKDPIQVNQTIQINVNALDKYVYPCESYLIVEGRLSSTGAAYGNGSLVTLINNAIPFLWKQIRYEINGQEIERIEYPGQATTMKGLLTYGSDLNPGEGLSMCWAKDTSDGVHHVGHGLKNDGFEARQTLIIQRPHTKGNFSFKIPLKHLMPFFEDYKKVMYGVKHTLEFTPGNINNAIFKLGADIAAVAVDGAAARPAVAAVAEPPNGQIELTRCSWIMPEITPSLYFKDKLTDLIMRKERIPLAYRSMMCETLDVPRSTSFKWRIAAKSGAEKPRWMLVAFQTNRSDNQSQNTAIFDNCGLTQISVRINSDKYPYDEVRSNFAEYRVAELFGSAVDFKKKYYGITELESSIGFSVSEFVRLYPIAVIDLRYQSESIKTAVQDIVISAEFAAAPAADTKAYAVMICDRSFYLQSDGNKFTKVN